MYQHRNPIAVAATVIVAAATALLVWSNRSDDQIVEGRRLYDQRCASCHGADLEGQPDWQARLPDGRLPAPPHDATGHTWHHPDQDLLVIVRDGIAAIVPGYETDMPAFAGTLTDAEIIAILAFIRSSWPERERLYQAERTAGWTSG